MIAIAFTLTFACGLAGDLTVSLPLNPAGEVDLRRVVERVAEATGAPAEPLGAEVGLPVLGVVGALGRQVLADALGPLVRVGTDGDELVLRIGEGALRPENRPAVEAGLKELTARGRREIERRSRYGMHARASYRPNDDERLTVCLVHGINSNSGVFVHMIPLLEQAGLGVVVFDFAYNRDLEDSSARFAKAWAEFRRARGERRPWSIVAHSMGSLIARSYVEGDDYAGDVDHLILLGPPNRGSRLAQVQSLLQWVEGVQAVRGKATNVLGHLGDGLGEAADDLLPGSRYLTALNRRPRRPGVAYHILAGDDGFLTIDARERIDARVAAIGKTSPLLGNVARLTLGDLPARLDELTDGRGDGCMTIEATRLEGVDDFEVIHANHVELIRGPALYPEPGPVVSLPFILSRLGRVDRRPLAERIATARHAIRIVPPGP